MSDSIESQDEIDFYKSWIGKRVFISHKSMNYMYRGEVLRYFNRKLVVDDIKVGEVIIDVDEIKTLERLRE